MDRARRCVLALCAAAGLATSAACRNADVVTGAYATLAEARAEGAIERGWVPEGLPPGSHDVREAHDLDTSRRWGLFSFPTDQRDALAALLEAQEFSVAGQTCDPPARIEWWPVLLRGRLDADKLRATGLQTYRARAGNLLFAVNWSQGRAYYWTPPTGT